ncbi:RNA-binding protein Pasilla [Anabrus simplex]|uniref:RNA-binding protein Pasilla n=1 Tax=Anabrus simplex TaxID=316456 RepID=UPI0034DD638E
MADNSEMSMEGYDSYSSEMGDSRKRQMQSGGNDSNNEGSKKFRQSESGTGTYHLKMLIPNAAAGAVIGKGGSTIAHIQKEYGAQIKISKADDFYPGTTERVCLISGSPDAIMASLNFINTKIREKPDINAKQAVDFDHKIIAEREKQVKILVPNTTAGIIIGKSGSYINQIKSESGAYIQISQKPKSVSLQERCVTVIGEPASNKKACEMILEKIIEDPQSGTLLDISYSDTVRPVANFNPTGSPYALGRNQRQQSIIDSIKAAAAAMSTNTGVTFMLNLVSPSSGSSISNALMDHILYSLQKNGYTEHETAEIVTAMGTLANYGILEMKMGLGPSLPSLPVPNGNSLFDSSSSSLGFSGSDYYGGGNTDGPQPLLPSLNESKTKETMEVNESIVGAILGPAGTALVAIQEISGTSIEISKKGVFAPGTRNRIVTIEGTSSAINQARYLIQVKISQEEAERARQNTI